MRNTENEKEFDYNNHLLIVISLTWTDVITISSFHSSDQLNLNSKTQTFLLNSNE